MIEQVGQGRMLAGQGQPRLALRRSPRGLAFVFAWAVTLVNSTAVWAQAASGDGAADRSTGAARQVEQTQREEGEAILALADAAMVITAGTAGKAGPSDFALRWQNDFVKAQRGTFVPFTLTVDATQFVKPAALVYVRAIRRPSAPPDRRREERDALPAGAEAAYPVDAIFPVELPPASAGVAASGSRISRGFSVLPGEYDVIVVMRERVDPATPRARPRVAVLRQPLSVPDFRTSELATSSVIVADRIAVLADAVPANQLAERPYVIGRNEITPAADRRFGRDEELIVVFLVYNPTVSPEGQFDVRVEYHFFRQGAAGAPVSEGHPAGRAGEQYFNRTEPQRFGRDLMGAAYDPGTGEPVMAGQVVPLAGFEAGDYRLDVQVTDLLSGKSISRDVLFTVGS
jgi:hypothetical protein